MTENAGFLFGALGIALLWLKAEQRSPAWFAAASFLLMLGLLARAGAFFVIPLLLLWSWIAFRDTRRVALRCTLALLGGALLAVLLHQAIDWYVGTDANVPFSNFSYTFYGLAVGGKGWLQVYADYPNEGIGTHKLFALAFEKIVENPFNIVIGYIKNLPHSTLRLFDYRPSFLDARLLIRFLIGLLWLAGLFAAFRRRREPQALLLLMATAGIVLSGPFLSDAGSRIYAATIPIDVYLAGFGFSAIFARSSRAPKQTKPPSTATPDLSAQLIGTGSVLVLLMLAGSFIFPSQQVSAQPAFACEAKETPAVLRLGDESPLVALRTKPPFTLFPPQVRHEDFVSLLYREVHLHEELKRLPPETVFIAGYARKESGPGSGVWMTWKTERLPPRGSLVGFCLKPGPHPVLGAAFHEPSRVQVLERN